MIITNADKRSDTCNDKRLMVYENRDYYDCNIVDPYKDVLHVMNTTLTF